MAEFRAASGLVAVNPMVRTASGLRPWIPVVFGQSGPISGGQPGNASASPAQARGTGHSPAGIRVTTAAATASPNFGSGPYSCAWTLDDPAWSAAYPTSQSTGFVSPLLYPGDNAETAARCTITDASGRAVITNDVSVEAANNYLDRGGTQ